VTLRTITPVEAQRLVDQGAVLVDIREADEHAREGIPGARHIALSKLDEADFAAHDGQTVILHCRSGARTASNSARLAAKASETCEAFIVEGGLEAWRKAGLPTIVDRRQPIELQRQVQIAAGALSFVGALLALTVSIWFLAIPLGVGAGLMFAGLTGLCGMARLLQRAPWNQVDQAAQ
jgi:rhodanese-related sulfurtransferase